MLTPLELISQLGQLYEKNFSMLSLWWVPKQDGHLLIFIMLQVAGKTLELDFTWLTTTFYYSLALTPLILSPLSLLALPILRDRNLLSMAS